MTKTENGQIVNPDNLTPMNPQSTQEDLASLRESLTLDIKEIGSAMPNLDIKCNPAVEENGAQRFEPSRVTKKGETIQGRALFVLSFNSPFSSGRTVIEGNSSVIRAALVPFLADPALAAKIRSARLRAAKVKLSHAENVVARLKAEVAALSAE